MALSFLSVSGRPSTSLISCLAAPPAPPPPNPNPTALPSLTCALQCPHFQSYAPPLQFRSSIEAPDLNSDPSITRISSNMHISTQFFLSQAARLGTLSCKASRTLSWWCFNPGIAMEEFSQLGVGSIILTSGTLSPMDSFAQEFKLEFPVRLENPHVISANQIWAGVVSAGPSSYSFNSSYRSRDSVEYKLELGNAIGI
ncbi:unnamed protein product [Camellia sinensis]